MRLFLLTACLLLATTSHGLAQEWATNKSPSKEQEPLSSQDEVALAVAVILGSSVCLSRFIRELGSREPTPSDSDSAPPPAHATPAVETLGTATTTEIPSDVIIVGVVSEPVATIPRCRTTASFPAAAAEAQPSCESTQLVHTPCSTSHAGSPFKYYLGLGIVGPTVIAAVAFMAFMVTRDGPKHVTVPKASPTQTELSPEEIFRRSTGAVYLITTLDEHGRRRLAAARCGRPVRRVFATTSGLSSLRHSLAALRLASGSLWPTPLIPCTTPRPVPSQPPERRTHCCRSAWSVLERTARQRIRTLALLGFSHIVNDSPLLDYHTDLVERGDVLQWVSIDDDEVGDFPCFDRAEVVRETKMFRSVACR